MNQSKVKQKWDVSVKYESIICFVFFFFRFQTAIRYRLRWQASFKAILFSPLGYSRTCIESHNIYWDKHITDCIGVSSFDVLLIFVSTSQVLPREDNKAARIAGITRLSFAKRYSWGEGRCKSVNSSSVCKLNRLEKCDSFTKRQWVVIFRKNYHQFRMFRVFLVTFCQLEAWF